MTTPSYSIRCLTKKLLAPGVYELLFEKPEGFTFKPGQFVLFDVPLLSNVSDIQPRAYSIASTPSEDGLLFVIKLKSGGRFSQWLEQKLSEGSSMTMKGPFGLFTLRQNAFTQIFAATGAGIAPFRSQILHALLSGNARTMHLFFGVRTTDDLFWSETFLECEKKYPNFRLHVCLSGTNPDWKGNIGRVQNFMPNVIADPAATELFICGAPEMVQDIKKLALETWGMPKANVHGEGYI